MYERWEKPAVQFQYLYSVLTWMLPTASDCELHLFDTNAIKRDKRYASLLSNIHLKTSY